MSKCMKIFIDSADIKEIEKYVSWGICDGVTTNPSICLKSGVSGGEEGMKQRLIEIARLIAPQPLSVEVTSDDLEQVLNQARKFNTWAENMTVNQAVLAAKAINAGMAKTSARKVHNISIFAGRISEEHGVEQAQKVLQDVRQWLDFHNYKNIEVIVGFVRSPENVELWSKSGAHILTVPPEVLAKCLVSARTKETVVHFINDASKSMQQL